MAANQRLEDGKKPAQRMNVVDRFVAFFNPLAGTQRMMARTVLHEFGYNERPHERGNSGGMAKNANSESHRKGRERIEAMWDARDLADYDWIGGTLGRIVLYTVGELHIKSTSGDPEQDALQDDYFHNWCGDNLDEDERTDCDFTGRFRFIKMLQQALFGFLVDVDYGFVKRRKKGSPEETWENPTGVPCLHATEADRIGSPIEATQDENYIGGLTLDPETGEVLTYRVYKRSRLGMYTDPKEIDNFNFLHLFDPKKSDLYRGRTSLLPVLEDVRDIREWIQAEKAAGKTQSQWAAAIGSKDGYSGKVGAAAWEGKTAAGTPTQEALWGKIIRLAEGENISMLSPSARPSGAFLAFIQTLFRKIAIALDLPYEFIWDLSGLGGVNSRIITQQAQRRINGFQRLLVDRIIRSVRKMVLSYGVAMGHIPAHPNMHKFDAHFGAWIVTDAGYETDNDVQLVKHGFLPASEVTAKTARNLEDVLESNADAVLIAQRVAAKKGVPIELFAGDWLVNATQQLAAINTPPAAPPKPGSLEAVGEKGAAQIIDLLSRVSTGQMERESAIRTLITVYGLSRKKAEEITPSKITPPDPKPGENNSDHTAS